MTFCILGHCETSDQIGIAYTTVTLAGGGTSPYYSLSGDIVVVQAYGNLATARVGAINLDQGRPLDQVMQAMRVADPAFEHRQIGIMRRDGTHSVRTGTQARPWAGHREGPDFISMGNVLVGQSVVDAMAEAFITTEGALADRLLQALEAGRDAGGQQGPNDRRYDERSALLRVIGAGQGYREVPAIDLRLDMQTDAVSELRRMYETYRPVVVRRLARAQDPAGDLPTSQWEAQNMLDNPPPPPFKE